MLHCISLCCQAASASPNAALKTLKRYENEHHSQQSSTNTRPGTGTGIPLSPSHRSFAQAPKDEPSIPTSTALFVLHLCLVGCDIPRRQPPFVDGRADEFIGTRWQQGGRGTVEVLIHLPQHRPQEEL
jgi:hypothetical protein